LHSQHEEGKKKGLVGVVPWLVKLCRAGGVVPWLVKLCRGW